MTKAIILLSDGTGNSRSDQFRTNVWKLYDALDLTDKARQIAYYDDGVGTSHFAPIRLLGGALGYGLARNVRDLYGFLCANYEPGDAIYLFGFSRGAFTVRVLGGLIAKKGVSRIDDEGERNAWVARAYREYRAEGDYLNRNPVRWVTVSVARGIKALFRGAGHAVRASFGTMGDAMRRMRGVAAPVPTRHEHYAPVDGEQLVSFIGVWDTVAAYGGPIVEMTRGFDKWVRRLSMPNYKLSPQVKRAVHALALDDEREAFLPLLWDETQSPDPDRITQVWFSGMHSDVGGGYPDEQLSSVPLQWMIAKIDPPLAFAQAKLDEIDRKATANGPMHDSRSGAAMFYRYQPRRIEALAMDGKSPIRDPASGQKDLLRKVIVHDSVIARTDAPIDGYAPIVLPAAFERETPAMGAPTYYGTDNATNRQIVQLVIWRRLLHFMVLLMIALTLATPYFGALNIGWVERLDKLMIPVVRAALSFVPLLPAAAGKAYAGYGVPIIGSVLIILALSWASNQARRKIAALALPMWKKEMGRPHDAPAATVMVSFPWYLRLYRAGNRFWRWRLLPAIFGIGFYVVLAAAFVQAAQFWRENVTGDPVCHRAKDAPVDMAFRTGEPCHGLGYPLEKDKVYLIGMTVTEPWRDGDIPASPLGFTYVDSVRAKLAAGQPAAAAKVLLVHLGGIVMRRELTSRWFVPIVAIRPADGGALRKVALRFKPLGECAPLCAYQAQFTAPVEGQAYLYVNDAVLPVGDARSDVFYRESGPGPNQGAAIVTIVPKLPDSCQAACAPAAPPAASAISSNERRRAP